MAYSGFLLKIGNYEFPLKYIKADTYSAYVNMQDVDDWTDANGYLHREAVELKVSKVEFETVPMLTNKTYFSIMSNIRSNYISGGEKGRECMITAYIPEYDDYVTQRGYMADFEPQMYFADKEKIQYDPIRLAFIGGVYNG